MPEQICLEERCPNAATHRGRCSTHAKQRDRSIERAAPAGFYQSLKWRKTREAKVLKNGGRCERCGMPVEEIHHRVAIADGGARYEMANLEALCKPCHSRATRQEQLV